VSWQDFGTRARRRIANYRQGEVVEGRQGARGSGGSGSGGGGEGCREATLRRRQRKLRVILSDPRAVLPLGGGRGRPSGRRESALGSMVGRGVLNLPRGAAAK
jgi:hypothetical protein